MATSFHLLGTLGNPRQALELAEKAVALDPDSWGTWSSRGSVFAELGQWTKAAADFKKAAELKSDDPLAWYYLALLRLQLGDRDAYGKACAAMMERFGGSPDSNAAYRTAWTCVLAPDAVTDWQPVMQLAERIVAADPKNYDKLQCLGAVLYRAGRFDEATKRLTEAEVAFQETEKPRNSINYNRLFQAMTHHRLGHSDEANKWLEDMHQPPPEGSKDPHADAWNRRLTLQLLRREAEELLKKESGISSSG